MSGVSPYNTYMGNLLALQEFDPAEQDSNSRCIWCKAQRRKNKAHIISRKLTQSSHPHTVLRRSVCEACNRTTGKVEEWVLRHTPLAWARFFLYAGSRISKSDISIPSYAYSTGLKTWLVFDLRSTDRSRFVPTQLLLFGDDLKAVGQEDAEKIRIDANRLMSKDPDFEYANGSLPDDFVSRLLLTKKGTALIGRDPRDNARLRKVVLTYRGASRTSEPKRVLAKMGEERQHFRWSRQNWSKFCAKVAFEMLSLCEGAEKCLGREFDTVRRFVLSGPVSAEDEIVFSETGPLGFEGHFTTSHVDLTNDQAAPSSLPVLLPGTEAGMHAVTLAQYHGLIYSSVTVSGLPACSLALAGPECHLSDLYIVIYDETEDRFSFTRLAYDKQRPVIPLPVAGDLFRTLAETYGLKPIST
jgi:hypothetical protein